MLCHIYAIDFMRDILRHDAAIRCRRLLRHAPPLFAIIAAAIYCHDAITLHAAADIASTLYAMPTLTLFSAFIMPLPPRYAATMTTLMSRYATMLIRFSRHTLFTSYAAAA